MTCTHANCEIIHNFSYDYCSGMLVWCPDCGGWSKHDEYDHEDDHQVRKDPTTWEWKLPNERAISGEGLKNQIRGGLQAAIDNHPNMTTRQIAGSAVKRIYGQVKAMLKGSGVELK